MAEHAGWTESILAYFIIIKYARIISHLLFITDFE